MGYLIRPYLPSHAKSHECFLGTVILKIGSRHGKEKQQQKLDNQHFYAARATVPGPKILNE
jgi:hypothetical protein